MRRIRLLGAWLVVLVLTTAVTWQIVNAAEGQINTNLPPVAVESPEADSTSTSTEQTEGPTTTSSTSRSQPAPTSTVTMPEPSGTLATPTTSPSTQAEESSWSLRTIESAGGSIVVRYRLGEVELLATTPAPGFQAEIDKDGPPDVRVEFESEDVDVRIEARWEVGGLEVKVSD